MNKTDQDFVNSVKRWRNNESLKSDIVCLISELELSNKDIHSECDSLFDVGFDYGFRSHSLMIADILKGIVIVNEK